MPSCPLSHAWDVQHRVRKPLKGVSCQPESSTIQIQKEEDRTLPGTLHASWVQCDNRQLLSWATSSQGGKPALSQDMARTSSGWVSFLLQQCGDIDAPTNGLSVEATGEEIAHRMVLTPCRAAHHSSVALPTAARQPRQPHARHVEQSHLPVVMWKGYNFLANTDIDPVDCRVRPDSRNGGPHVLQVPDLHGAVVTA